MQLDTLEGWLTGNEGMMLRSIARQVAPEQPIVEIGSYMGKSTAYLCEGSRVGRGAHITCIDPWVGEDISWYTDATSDDMIRTFRDVITTGGWWDLVTPLRMASQDAALAWLQPAGLIFIDADHTYESAASDFRLWAPHVASGGTLAFHDYSPAWPGIVAALDSSHDARFGTVNVTDSLWVTTRR